MELIVNRIGNLIYGKLQRLNLMYGLVAIRTEGKFIDEDKVEASVELPVKVVEIC